MQSLGWGDLTGGQIPSRRRPDLAGGRLLELLGTELGQEVSLAGRQRGRWQPAAAPVRCACRGLLPGSGGIHVWCRATVEASEGAREGTRMGRRWSAGAVVGQGSDGALVSGGRRS
jgi:hypothetical protein